MKYPSILENTVYPVIFAMSQFSLFCDLFYNAKYSLHRNFIWYCLFLENFKSQKMTQIKKLNIFPIFANFITKKTDKRLLIQKVMASVVCLLHLVIDPEMFSATTQCESDLYQYVIR